jgi:hypothetical protein
MSEEAYALVAALSALASLVVLYLRFRQAYLLRKLKRSLEAQGYRFTRDGILPPPKPDDTQP